MDTSLSELSCPYCGEMITLVVDQSGQEQQYVEDCFVCCRPILVSIRMDGLDDPIVTLYHENEVPNP